MVAAVLIVGIFGGYAAYAAIRHPTPNGNIVVRVIDTTPILGIPLGTSGGREPLPEVIVDIARVNTSGATCMGTEGVTGTVTDPRNPRRHITGATLFTKCPASPAGIKYVIRNAQKIDYRIDVERNRHQLKTGQFVLKSGNIKQRTTIVTLYMRHIHSLHLPPTPPVIRFVPFQCGIAEAIGHDSVALSPGCPTEQTNQGSQI
jgi:hypothetical protein